MINEYLKIQQTINQYSCYVKNLINGLCEEFQTNKIHLRRITSILDRLFVIESSDFKSFFNLEKGSTATQFIHYLSEQGEIIHLGNSYYTLPPERTIQLPNGQYVSISSLEVEENGKTIGIGQLKSHPLAINLLYSEYLYRPNLNQLLTLYTKKLTSNHDIEPDEMLVFSDKSYYKTSKIRNMQEDDFYILFYNRLIGSKIKPEKYFAQWKKGEWHVTQIPNRMYIRLRQALCIRKRVFSTYHIIQQENYYIEIKLGSILPREENILLRLISIPNEFRWPKSYITTYNQIENVRAILGHYQLKEEGV